MNKNRWEGHWNHLVGLAEELLGEIRGDAELFAKGQQLERLGRLQEQYGMSVREARKRLGEAPSD